MRLIPIDVALAITRFSTFGRGSARTSTTSTGGGGSLDVHLQSVVVDAKDAAAPDPAAGEADHELVAGGSAMHARDVTQTAAGEPRAAWLDEVVFEEKDEVHSYIIARTMNIETRKKGDVVIVDFQGRLAVGVGDEVLPRLVTTLLDEGNRKILLNLSEMEYIDSNGLGELVQSLKTSKRFGAQLVLLKPQDRVRKTLRLTNLLPMFSVYETEAEALKSFTA